MTHQKVHDFLKKHPAGVLSTATSDGKPWGAAIYFVADEDFNFYFNTRAKTAKYQNIEANPQVALTITDPATMVTVQVAGTVSKLPAEQYMDIVFGKLADAIRPKDDIHWAPPLSRLHAGDYMPLQLKPDHLQYADYGQRKTDPNESYIETII